MGIRRPLGLSAIAAVLLAGCATARIAPIGTSGPAFTPDADERVLWTRADAEAAALLQRVKVYEDPAFATYLAGIVERLTPDRVKAAGGPVVRVAVIRDPTLAAFALPSGRLFVHTGLVAAVESEAQLALVLGRELAHVFQRHALGAWRAGQVPAACACAGVVAPGGPTAGAIAAANLPLATLGALTGYPEALEREADDVGLTSVAHGGWDAGEASAVWSALTRELSGRGELETLLLGRPAWIQARMQSSGRRPPAAGAPAEAFETLRRALVRDNAADDVRRGRFAPARRQLDRLLAAAPTDASAHLVYGDLHRLQSQRASSAEERDAEIRQARVRYTGALALDPALAAAHRQLGLLHYQQQDFPRARAELAEYLAGAAGAADAARIAEYLKELAR